MTNKITNAVLLEHIHVTKSNLLSELQKMHKDLQNQITKLDAKIGIIDQKIGGHDTKIGNLEGSLQSLAYHMEQGFKDAREHRQMLQEDLYASMRMLRRYDTKLSRLKRSS